MAKSKEMKTLAVVRFPATPSAVSVTKRLKSVAFLYHFSGERYGSPFTCRSLLSPTGTARNPVRESRLARAFLMEQIGHEEGTR